MIRASSILLYLGLGLAVQVIGYSDTTFRTLLSTDASLSTWAHILAWPLFLMLLCGYYFLWFMGVCLVIGLGAFGYGAFSDWRRVRTLRNERQARQRRPA